MSEVAVSLKYILFKQGHAFHYKIHFRISAPTFHKVQNILQ